MGVVASWFWGGADLDDWCGIGGACLALILAAKKVFDPRPYCIASYYKYSSYFEHRPSGIEAEVLIQHR